MVDVVIRPARTVVQANTVDPVGNNVLLRFQHGIHPTRVPLSLAVVMDTSGSMSDPAGGGESKLEKVRKAIRHLIDEAVLDPGDELILVDFDNHARRLYQGPISDKLAIARAVDSMQACGGTRLATGLDEALSALDQARHGQQQIVIFTDGIVHDQEIVEGRSLKQLQQRELSVIAFGVGEEYQWQLLSQLADATRGGYYHLTTLDLFGDQLQGDLIHAKNQAIRDVRMRLRTSKGVKLKRLVRVVPFAEIEGKTGEYLLGNMRGDATTAFVLQLELPSRPAGRFRVLVAELSWEYEGCREQDEQVIYVEYVDDREVYRQARTDPEVIDYVRQAQIQVLTSAAVRTANAKAAEEKLKEARNITRVLGNPLMERSLTQAMSDLKSKGRISPETVRRCVSDARNTTRQSQFTPPPKGQK